MATRVLDLHGSPSVIIPERVDPRPSAIAHLAGGRFGFHAVTKARVVSVFGRGRVAVCGRCGSRPDAPAARTCTAVRCPLVKTDSVHERQPA